MTTTFFEPGDKVGLDDESSVEFDCPFCEGGCVYGSNEDSLLVLVSHTIPMCAAFRDNDPNQFITKCVNEVKKKAPN